MLNQTFLNNPMAGNLTMIQVAEIAAKHRLKMNVPATCIIGRSGHDFKDRFIYTDPKTNTLVVKRHAIDIFHIR